MIRAGALASLLALAGGASASAADPADVGQCMTGGGPPAIEACTRALAAETLGDWDRANVLERRARHHRRARAFFLALADYEAALLLTPDKPSLLIGRGEARGEAPSDQAGPDALPRAIADFDAALAIRPGDPTALARRGHAKALLGDLNGAIADLDAALADPAKAAVLGSQGLAAQATENRAFALNARAWERLAAGDRAGALADAAAAAAALPDEPTLHDTHAHALSAMGDAAAALAAHGRVLSLGGAPWEETYRDALLVQGFPAAPGVDGVMAALSACVDVDCRPMAPAR